MHHYIALAWPRHNASATATANRVREVLRHTPNAWNDIFQADGLIVCARKAVDPAMRAYVLPNNAGVIFGRIFSTSHPDHHIQDTDLDSAEIVRSQGRKLVQDYWGAYVAILRPPDTHTALVMRDCSGRIPCYYLTTAGVRVFFSDIQDVEPLGVTFALNYSWLAAYIHRAPVHVRETGLREVSALLAGDCVSVSTAGITHLMLWNPRSIAERAMIDDYDAAEVQLRMVTRQVIQAWAGQYNRILLKLSGGLDSAVVLGCLRESGIRDTICINHYTGGSDDDERAYARRAASMADAQLFELPRVSNAQFFVDSLHRLPPSPSPDIPSALGMLAADGIGDIAKSHHCDTVWTGQGGDHVFFQLNTYFPAIDYLRTHALPIRFPSLLYDSAVLSRRSIWPILHQAIRYWLKPRTLPPNPFGHSADSLVNPAALADLPDSYTASHWRQGAEKVPPGKQLQIDVYLDLLNRHKPSPAQWGLHECHPLISQPLLELSLRIPTYHLLSGGRQRAMARAAFANCVPAEILLREDKGSIRNQSRSLIRGCGAMLHDSLLNGTLVSAGIVSRARLENILLGSESYRDTEIMALLGCMVVEAWADHWITPDPPAPA